MSEAFEEFAATLDPALVVVTTAVAGEWAGCLVGFHAQSSIDPARYCVWLSKANHTARVAQRGTHLAVHRLGEGDLAVAKRFGTMTGDESDKFAGLAVSEGTGGVPLLDGCPSRLLLRRHVLVDEGGDHLCVIGDVVGAWSAGPSRPLRLSQAAGLDAGRGSGERPEPPTERAG